MKKVIAAGLLCLCLSPEVFSQKKTTPEELLTDIVSVRDKKYSMDVYRLVTNEDGTSTQVKAHSEAPLDAISRDQFLYYSSIIMSQIIDDYTPETSTETDLDELIGNADIEINLFMTKNGLQVESKTLVGTTRFTKKWDDY